MNIIASILREPLCHFVMLSVCLYVWIHNNHHTSEKLITVTKAQHDQLAARYIEQHRRIPSKKALQDLLYKEIMNEVLFQQGLTYQLDQQDPVVRRRVIQKMNFILEAQATPTSPTLNELNDYLNNNLDSFTDETRYDISHLFFRTSENQPAFDRALSVLSQLDENNTETLGKTPSDPFMRGLSFNSVSISQISNTLGILDKRALLSLQRAPENQWIGPIQSRFGVHLIHIHQIIPALKPTLTSHRHEVYAAWKKFQQQQRLAQLKRDLLDDYDIELEGIDNATEDNKTLMRHTQNHLQDQERAKHHVAVR